MLFLMLGSQGRRFKDCFSTVRHCKTSCRLILYCFVAWVILFASVLYLLLRDVWIGGRWCRRRRSSLAEEAFCRPMTNQIWIKTTFIFKIPVFERNNASPCKWPLTLLHSFKQKHCVWNILSQLKALSYTNQNTVTFLSFWLFTLFFTLFCHFFSSLWIVV